MDRKVTAAWGRWVSAAGGGPNEPLVMITGDVYWHTPHNARRPNLKPETIWIKAAVICDGDHETLRKLAEHDIDRWRSAERGRAQQAALVITDTGQIPAAALMLAAGNRTSHPQTRFFNYRVNAGLDDGTTAPGAAVSVGAQYLVSHFDGQVDKSLDAQPDPGASDRVRMTFAKYDGDFEAPDGTAVSHMAKGAVQSSLASAESLVKRTSAMDDALVGLNPDESTAIAVMLPMLCLSRMAPPTAPGSRGWQSGSRGNRDLRRIRY